MKKMFSISGDIGERRDTHKEHQCLGACAALYCPADTLSTFLTVKRQETGCEKLWIMSSVSFYYNRHSQHRSHTLPDVLRATQSVFRVVIWMKLIHLWVMPGCFHTKGSVVWRTDCGVPIIGI